MQLALIYRMLLFVYNIITNSDGESYRTRGKLATNAPDVGNRTCVGAVDKCCCRSNTGADMSEDVADLHTLNLKASILRSYSRNIEPRPAQIDSGTEVKFTPGRSIAAITVNWNERTGRCSPTTLGIFVECDIKNLASC